MTPSATSTSNLDLIESPVQIPLDAVESVPAKGVVRYASQDAGLFTYASADQVYAADAEHGTKSLFVADPGFQVMGVDSDLGYYGRVSAWAEGSYERHTGRVPCSDSGAITWRLFVETDSGAQQVASGVNSRVGFCTAAKPLFAVYGDLIAYAEEAPRDSHPQAWRINVVNINDGSTVREIETDDDIFSLDLANSDVAYTDGTLDPDVDPYQEFNTRLMLATVDDVQPRQIASDAYDVSFDHDRLAWIDDQSLGKRNENAPGPQVMTATLSDLAPKVLARLDVRPSVPPEATQDYVTWIDNLAIDIASPDQHIIWTAVGAGDVAWSSSRYDTLAWNTLNDDGSESLNSYPLAKLLPDISTTSPTPSVSPQVSGSPPASLAPPQAIVVDGTSWQRLDASSLPNVDYMVPTSGRGRILGLGAVGCIPMADCGQSTTLFSSSDGITWSVLGRVPDGSRGAVFETQWGLFVTAGANGEWYSQDGSTWTFDGGNWGLQAAQCEASNGGIYSFFDTSPGLLGYGSGFWHSDDGTSWQCIGPRENIASVAYRNGTYVGSGAAQPGSEKGMLFASGDAVTWHPTQPTPKFLSPVPVADGFLALNEDFRNAQPDVLYTSSDGQKWNKQPNPFGSISLWPLTSDGMHAAVLEDRSREPDAPGAVWVSSGDGNQWTRYQLPIRAGDEEVWLAIVGDTVVVSGTHYNGDAQPYTPVVWVARIP